MLLLETSNHIYDEHKHVMSPSVIYIYIASLNQKSSHKNIILEKYCSFGKKVKLTNSMMPDLTNSTTHDPYPNLTMA